MFLAALALFVGVSRQVSALEFVPVAAPAINCVFDASCTIVVSDSTSDITLPGTTGSGFLQSRTFTGAPGTPGAGVTGYEYRIDLTHITALTATSCIDTLTMEFGNPVRLDYDGDETADDGYVVAAGGLGSVGPASVDQTGTTIVFHFSGLCPGATTFFFGLAAATPPGRVTATIHETAAGTVIHLDARAPLPTSTTIAPTTTTTTPTTTATTPTTTTTTTTSAGITTPLCGNGLLDEGEACDEGALNGTPGSCCGEDCTLRPVGQVCRPQASFCDVAEQCDGSAGSCPTDGFVIDRTPCVDGDPCTVEDTCEAGACQGGSRICSVNVTPVTPKRGVPRISVACGGSGADGGFCEAVGLVDGTGVPAAQVELGPEVRDRHGSSPVRVTHRIRRPLRGDSTTLVLRLNATGRRLLTRQPGPIQSLAVQVPVAVDTARGKIVLTKLITLLRQRQR